MASPSPSPSPASTSFDQTSLAWQVQRLTRQWGEGIERWFTANSNTADSDVPQIPEWLLKGLFWLVVAGILGWLGWQAYQLLRPYLTMQGRLGQGQERQAAPPTWQTVSDWLRQARTAQQHGNYPEACRALYMATLQRLSDQGKIAQEPSRTDGEYLRLVHSLNLPPPYQVVIGIHEQMCFDRVSVSSDTYQRCWQAYQEIAQS